MTTETQKKVDLISNLIIAYTNKTITPQEQETLMQWVNASDHNKQCFEKWTNPKYMRKALKQAYMVDSKTIFEKTMKKIESLNS